MAGLSALSSAISDQTAQACPQACEGVTPQPLAVSPEACERHSGKGAGGRQWRQREMQGPDGLCPLTHDLVLLQVDGLQGRQGGELLRKVAELVPRQVDGLEVLQGTDLAGEAVQAVPFQAELCRVGGKGRKCERESNGDPCRQPSGRLGRDGPSPARGFRGSRAQGPRTRVLSDQGRSAGSQTEAKTPGPK